MEPGENWAGNYRFRAARLHRPVTIDALRRLVAVTPKIRAVGSRHSFNGIADSPGGDMVDLAGIDPDFAIDRGRMAVTVGGGTSYATLAAHLHREGFALHNLASLPHISVAGAVATGTHGSGDGNGPLSSAVAALEFVQADGSLRHVARGEAAFDAMVVGLGAFGIVTRVTLDIGPTFDVRQDAFVQLPWEDMLANFDALSACAYSVSLMTMWSSPSVDRVWLKTRLGEPLLPDLPIAHLRLQPGPAYAIPVDAPDPTDKYTLFGGIPGPWSERLAHFRPDAVPGAAEQIQSEYLVSRASFPAAVRAIRAIADRVDPLLLAAEIRTMAADTLWLSPAYLQDTVGLHFTWKMQPGPVDAITRELEARLIPLGARPHWGKIIHAGAGTLGPLYPRFTEFGELARRADPDGKFRNPFLERHIFADA